MCSSDLWYRPIRTGSGYAAPILVTWNGFNIPFHIPPEYFTIDVFSLPDGKQVAVYSLPREKDSCSSENSCTFKSTISAGDLPAGDFMLIATDPLSAAFDRQVITVRSPGPGPARVQLKVAHEKIFYWSSSALVLILIALLAMLIHKPGSRP